MSRPGNSPEGARRVLVLAYSVVANDPRVARQVWALRPHFDVTVAGYGTSSAANDFIPLERPPDRSASLARWLTDRLVGALLLILRRFHLYEARRPEARAARRLASCEFDLVLSNDVETLPLAFQIAGDRPVAVDAHEYSPQQFTDRWTWRWTRQRYLEYVCASYLPRTSKLSTVSGTIADRYAQEYGIDTMVIMNLPPFEKLEPSPVRESTLRLVHHGAAVPSRRIERLFDLLELLDNRFTLDLFLTHGNNPVYLDRLRQMSEQNPRVTWHAPVPMEEICRSINEFDIGVFLLPPANFNYSSALPNKFFEFIQARLMVAIGPTLEMANYTNAHGLGVVAPDFEPSSLAGQLNDLDAKSVRRFKSAADGVAQSYSFEAAAPLVRQFVAEALERA